MYDRYRKLHGKLGPHDHSKKFSALREYINAAAQHVRSTDVEHLDAAMQSFRGELTAMSTACSRLVEMLNNPPTSQAQAISRATEAPSLANRIAAPWTFPLRQFPDITPTNQPANQNDAPAANRTGWIGPYGLSDEPPELIENAPEPDREIPVTKIPDDILDDGLKPDEKEDLGRLLGVMLDRPRSLDELFEAVKSFFEQKIRLMEEREQLSKDAEKNQRRLEEIDESLRFFDEMVERIRKDAEERHPR